MLKHNFPLMLNFQFLPHKEIKLMHSVFLDFKLQPFQLLV